MSPFTSVKQRTWMKIHEPEIYKKWKKKYGTKIYPKKSSSKPRKKKKG